MEDNMILSITLALVFIAIFVQSMERFLAHLENGIKKGWLFLTIASLLGTLVMVGVILTSLGVK